MSAALEIAHSAAPWELIQIILFQLLAVGLDEMYLYTRYDIDRKYVCKDITIERGRKTIMMGR